MLMKLTTGNRSYFDVLSPKVDFSDCIFLSSLLSCHSSGSDEQKFAPKINLKISLSIGKRKLNLKLDFCVVNKSVWKVAGSNPTPYPNFFYKFIKLCVSNIEELGQDHSE